MQDELSMAVILITHDLGVVAEHCARIAVMYAGRIAESGTADDIFYRPRHPYTWGLLQSIPRLDQERTERLRPIRGQPPSLIHVPSGCPFHPRCDHVMDICRGVEPPLEPASGHRDACHLSAADKDRIGTGLARTLT
jgi:peptide/nickel transport system ATP-binding protein